MKETGKSKKAFKITIEKLVYGGAGLGRHQGKVVFVPFSVPGDRLLVSPVADKKTFIRAEIVAILEPGNGRIKPLCPHFAICGGCHWQQLEYSLQVEAKKRILEALFHHRFPQSRELPIDMKACVQPFGYRSRARVQLRGGGSRASVGFFRSGSNRIEDIENCPLFRPALNEALNALRQYRRGFGEDAEAQEMDMACSEEGHAWTMAPTGSETGEGISASSGTAKKEDVVLHRKIGEFLYCVKAPVFFQANDFMVPELVELVRGAAKGSGNRSALDLFAGVGLFSLPLARQFEEVTAVESSRAASGLCRDNAGAAGFSHIHIACADVTDWMDSMVSAKACTKHPFELIVLDPPRSGAGPLIMKTINKWAPGTILYISCDPQTLARDLAVISPRDYTIDLVEGLDMFPQTFHFETVVRLKRKDSRQSAVGSRQ
jgi:23S rRNA (uracil1939-C5)-methyltransferase